jgi:asparagine synthase (glutamine-hydrolysing)
VFNSKLRNLLIMESIEDPIPSRSPNELVGIFGMDSEAAMRIVSRARNYPVEREPGFVEEEEISDTGRQRTVANPLIFAPMLGSGTTALVGRISNASVLRCALALPVESANREADAELVGAAYRAWGEQATDRFEGEFALITTNPRTGRVTFANDRLGKRRLWFARQHDGLVVSSHPRILMSLLTPRPTINPSALAYLMTLGYVPSPCTMWTEVERLSPGHFGTWDVATGLHCSAFWQPPTALADPDDKVQLAGLLETAIENTVDLQNRTGLLLSAGLDSASLALACAQLGSSIHPLTLQSPGLRSEATLAFQLATHLGYRTEVETIEHRDFDSLALVVAATYSEPQAFFAQLTSIAISQLARTRGKIWLTGDGAEELFAGYTWYPGHPRPRRSRLRRLRQIFVSPSKAKATVNGDAERAAFACRSPLHGHLLRMRPGMLLPEEVNGVLAPTGIRFRDEELLEPLVRHFRPELPIRRALQRVDLMSLCADGILPKLAASGRAFGLNFRCPLLDRTIVDWALSRPVIEREYRERKPYLIDYLRNRVPSGVLSHPKHGYNPRWHQLMDSDRSLQIVRESAWLRNGTLSSSALALGRPGEPYWQERLWMLRNLSSWGEAWGFS